MEQAQASGLEVQSLIERQKLCQEQLRLRQEEVEQLSKRNDNLVEEITAEKTAVNGRLLKYSKIFVFVYVFCENTITALKNERKHYLEEKNVLCTICKKLKSEISRAGELEKTVASMSKETNKLSVISNSKLPSTKLAFQFFFRL